MSTDTSSSEDESLAAYAAVAVSGDAVRANAAESGAKAVKGRSASAGGRSEDAQALKKLGRTENKLWEALKKRLDRDLAVGTPTSSGSSSGGDDSDSRGEDQSESSNEEDGGSRQNAARGQPPTAVSPADGFRFFGGRKRKPKAAHDAERPDAAATFSQQPGPSDRLADGGAIMPRLATSLAELEVGRKRTHEELVQLLGDDAPRAPNRKKRRLELQGPKRLRRQKNLERIAKATGEAKAALMEGLSDKARAKLTKKQLRHERAKAKLEKRRRRKAAKAAEERWRARKGLPRKEAGEDGSGGDSKGKRKKAAVKRGKFSTRHAHGVTKERNKAKYNKKKDAVKAKAAASQ